MRILHTADWHLGRVFHGTSLLDDQARVLDEIFDITRAVQPDCVVIAGDLYDRTVPPPEAVRLLDDILEKLVLKVGVDVIVIAGNHDSPERIGFAGRLLTHARLHVVARPIDALRPIVLLDEHGPCEILALPFVEPEFLRRDLALLPGGALSSTIMARLASVRTPSDALRVLLDAAQPRAAGQRRVVVAHGSLHGAQTSDSERALPGGASVDVGIFEGAAYVALGHHHRAQDVGSERVRYSGSPLMYSFAETGHGKSVTVVDIGRDGAIMREIVPLTRGRTLAVIEGTLATLLATPDPQIADCYVKARLLDEGPVLDPHARLAQHYPHLLVVEHARLRHREEDRTATREAAPLDDAGLFRAFFADVTGTRMSDDEARTFDAIHATLESERRGGG